MSVSLPSYTRLPSTTHRGGNEPPLSLSPPPPHLPPAPHRKRTVTLLNQLKRPQAVLAGCAALLVLSLTWNKSDSTAGSSSLRRVLAADDDEFQCNPFEANGRLRYDPEVLENNVWVPYDDRCQPSNYMAPLAAAAAAADQHAHLAWFANRTIVLHSDSIDRFHMKDFCDFVGGQLANIHPQHPASPPMYRDPHADAERRKLEEQWTNRPPEGWELTSPWVCDVERYGTTLVNVFQFGLEGGEQFYQNERWYYPPGTSLLCLLLLLLLRANFS